jgi:hypothetical protein
VKRNKRKAVYYEKEQLRGDKMNPLIIIVTALLLSASIFGYTNHATKDTLPKEGNQTVQLQQPVAEDEADIVRKVVSYQNTQYSFKFPCRIVGEVIRL